MTVLSKADTVRSTHLLELSGSWWPPLKVGWRKYAKGNYKTSRL